MLTRSALAALVSLTLVAGAALAQGAPPAPQPGAAPPKVEDANKVLRSGPSDKADDKAPAAKSEPPLDSDKPGKAGKADRSDDGTKRAPGAPGRKADGGVSPKGQVARYLVDARANMQRRGFMQCRPSWIVTQAEGKNVTKTFSMTSGKACEVAARCDNDCSDIDIWILSPKGGEIGQAVGLTDEEHLAFVPTTSGNYSIRTAMPGCRNKQGCVGGVLVCCAR